MRRTAIDETGRVVDIRDVPQDLAERHRHTYTCEGCGGVLIPRKGSVRVHHFAHASDAECDRWAQGMTEWHLTGQDRMQELGARLEVPCDGLEFNHRADAVFDAHSTIVELQHSPISVDVFVERSEFYLSKFENLVWLFDARDFADRLEFRDGADGRRCHGDDDGCWRRVVNKRGLEDLGCPNPRGWFAEAVGDCWGWHAKGMSLALYVSGGDDLSDGYVAEVFPRHGHLSFHNECHVWRFDDWVRILAKGNLPFMRRSTVRYRFEDGHVEEATARYGEPVPLPETLDEIPWYVRRTWVCDGVEMDPKTYTMPPRGTLEFHERTFVPRASVALWIQRRGQRGRRPDVSLRSLPINTPMTDVIRRARKQVGEWRADDYDWDALRDREFLERDVKLTLRVLDGRRRHPLTIVDIDTGEEISKSWHYETTRICDAVEEAMKSIPPSVLGRYVWDVRETAPLRVPMEVRIRKRPEARQVMVVVCDPQGAELLRRPVGGTVSWEGVRDLARASVEDADLYDWDSLPEVPIANGPSPRAWVLRGKPRRVSVTLDGDELLAFDVPYGSTSEDLIDELRRRIPSFYSMFTFTLIPDTRHVLKDAEVVLYRDMRARRPVLVHDGMSDGLPMSFRMPYWTSSADSTVIDGLPPALPPWADRFDGLFAIDGDGTPVRAVRPDMTADLPAMRLASVRDLHCGYRYGDDIVFSQEDVERIEQEKATAQLGLF